jgi:hypothetical protein
MLSNRIPPIKSLPKGIKQFQQILPQIKFIYSNKKY